MVAAVAVHEPPPERRMEGMDGWMDTETDEHNSQTAGQALRRFVTLASPLEEEDEEDPRFLSMQQGKGRLLLLLLEVLARSLFLPSAGTTSKAKQPPARAPSSGFCRARAQVAASSRAAVPEPGPGCTRRSILQPRLARRKHAHSRGPAGEGRRARRARDHVSLLARKAQIKTASIIETWSLSGWRKWWAEPWGKRRALSYIYLWRLRFLQVPRCVISPQLHGMWSPGRGGIGCLPYNAWPSR